MNRKSFVATLTLVFVSAAAPLAAQGVDGRSVHFGVMGGRTKPAGDLSSATTNDWNLGGLVLFGAPESKLRFRVDGQWQQIAGKTGGGGLACMTCSYNTTARGYRVVDATANAVFSGAVTGSTRLYLVDGVGVYNTRGTTVSSVNGEFSRESESVTRFGLNGGAGASFKFGRHAAFVEARLHNLIGSSAFGIDGFYNVAPRNFQFLPFNVGIVF